MALPPTVLMTPAWGKRTSEIPWFMGYFPLFSPFPFGERDGEDAGGGHGWDVVHGGVFW